MYIGGLKVQIYFKDHNPPHVHVIGRGAEARFYLDTLECYYVRGFNEWETNRMKKKLREQKSRLLEAWNEYQEE